MSELQSEPIDTDVFWPSCMLPAPSAPVILPETVALPSANMSGACCLVLLGQANIATCSSSVVSTPMSSGAGKEGFWPKSSDKD